jgi:transposase
MPTLRAIFCVEKTFNKFSAEQIEKVIEFSRDSLGVPATEQQAELVRTIAREALDCRARLKELEDRMRKLCEQSDPCARVASAIGPAAAVAIFADLGDPTAYTSAAAFVKACGLNLRERSSGTHQGQLHITKRGPGRVRRYLFLAAMRMILSSPLVRRWYERRGAYREGIKHKAIVAIMRKLARAMVHVARGSAFDINKLFDVRRLDLTATHQASSAVATT